MDSKKPAVISNPWRSLRQFTDARIGLGHAGVSLPTDALLEFQLAHARARDAVHFPLNVDSLIDALSNCGVQQQLGDPLCVSSQAPDRATYLQRPDLGRQLSESSQHAIKTATDSHAEFDLALVIVDGLSPTGIQQHAAPFVAAFLNTLHKASRIRGYRLAPLTLVEQGRVAIGDQIGAELKARQVIVLIGERPGLSSPDSLGAYLTYAPVVGKSDAERNCISNIRPRGLAFQEAARRLVYLLEEADRLGTSGIALKDRSDETPIEPASGGGNFLVK